MDIRRMGAADLHRVLGAGHLFDSPPRPDWAGVFLNRDGHHLLLAEVGASSRP